MFCIVLFIKLYLKITYKLILMKKILVALFLITFTSCGYINPVVEVKTDLNITIDGENIDGIQGEWIIIQEEEKKDGKNTVVIRIEKKEI